MSNAALLTGTSQKAGTRKMQSPASAVRHFKNSATYSVARTFSSPSVFKYSRQTLSLHRLCQQLTDGQQNVLQVDKEDTGAANALPAAGKHPERTCNAQESFPSTFTGGFTLPATCVSLPGICFVFTSLRPPSPTPPLLVLLPVRPSWADRSSHYLTK